jgi:hypothetical protein
MDIQKNKHITEEVKKETNDSTKEKRSSGQRIKLLRNKKSER